MECRLVIIRGMLVMHSQCSLGKGQLFNMFNNSRTVFTIFKMWQMNSLYLRQPELAKMEILDTHEKSIVFHHNYQAVLRQTTLVQALCTIYNSCNSNKNSCELTHMVFSILTKLICQFCSHLCFACQVHQ